MEATQYTEITEMPGWKVSAEELEMIQLRYVTAAQYAKQASILEVGCGAALGFSYLLKQGAEAVTGLDYNPQTIRQAAQVHRHEKRIHLVQGDAHHLPFPDASFDLVLMFEVVFYLKDVSRCFSEVRRVLKEGGRFVLCQPNPSLPAFVPSRHSEKYMDEGELKAALSHHFSKVSLYGAYSAGSSLKVHLRAVRIQLAKVLNTFEWTQKFKRRMKDKIFQRELEVPSQFCDLPDLTLPLEIRGQKHHYRTIYAVALK